MDQYKTENILIKLGYKYIGQKQTKIAHWLPKTLIAIDNRLPLMKFSIALVSLPSSFKTDTALFTYQIEIIEYTQDIHQ